MTELKDAIARLSGMLNPGPGASNGAGVRAPGPDDPNGAFKQGLIAHARTTLGLGHAALAGIAMQVPDLAGSTGIEIQTLLANDPEQREFHALVEAIRAVANALNRPAS